MDDIAAVATCCPCVDDAYTYVDVLSIYYDEDPALAAYGSRLANTVRHSARGGVPAGVVSIQIVRTHGSHTTGWY